MATRIFLHLAYKGTAYHGWQSQADPALPTVQSTLEDCLRKMLGYPVHLHGCGRTDAGVHARSYYAHFDQRAPLDYDPVFRLNRMLPEDIAVYEWLPVAPKANAQLDATRRTYEYRIDLVKNPFRARLSGRYDDRPLDIDAMRETVLRYAAATDFRAFCKSPEQYPHTRCRIDRCTLEEVETGKALLFTITADRFLQSMVRLLVARLVDVGMGKLSLGEIEAALSEGTPLSRKRAAYAEGLYLVDVGYDFIQPNPA